MSSLQSPAGGPLRRLARSIGRVVRSVPGREVHHSRLDAEGSQPQQAVITISGNTNGAFTVEVADAGTPGTGISVQFSFTAASSSIDDIVTGLAAAANAAIADEGLGFLMEAAVADLAANTVTLDFHPGVAATITEIADPGTDMAIVNTAATSAPSYGFGDAVARTGIVSGQPDNGLSSGVQRPVITDTQSTLTYTLNTNANTETSSLDLIHTPYGGVPDARPLAYTAGASAAATTAAIATAAGTRFPTATVTDNSGASVVIAFPAGDSIGIGALTESGALDVSAAVAAGSLPTFELVRATDDVVQFGTYPGTSEGVSAHLAGNAIPTAGVSGSTIYAVAATSTSIVDGDLVYVGTSGAERGQLYRSASSTRVPWPQATFRGLDPNNSSVAHIEL